MHAPFLLLFSLMTLLQGIAPAQRRASEGETFRAQGPASMMAWAHPDAVRRWQHARIDDTRIEYRRTRLELDALLHPHEADRFDALGVLHEQQGHRDAALRNYRRALRIDATHVHAAGRLRVLERRANPPRLAR